MSQPFFPEGGLGNDRRLRRRRRTTTSWRSFGAFIVGSRSRRHGRAAWAGASTIRSRSGAPIPIPREWIACFRRVVTRHPLGRARRADRLDRQLLRLADPRGRQSLRRLSRRHLRRHHRHGRLRPPPALARRRRVGCALRAVVRPVPPDRLRARARQAGGGRRVGRRVVRRPIPAATIRSSCRGCSRPSPRTTTSSRTRPTSTTRRRASARRSERPEPPRGRALPRAVRPPLSALLDAPVASRYGRFMTTGGCLCGAVRYRLLESSQGATHCHCCMCRKQHGAAFATYARYRREAVEIVRSGYVAQRVPLFGAGTAGVLSRVRLESVLAARGSSGVVLGGARHARRRTRSPASGAHLREDKASWTRICDDLPQHE